MRFSSLDDEDLGHDYSRNADDPLVKYSNIITEVGDLNANDLSIILAGRESCNGTPIPLTRAETSFPEHVHNFSVGSNDDKPFSVEIDSSTTTFPLLMHVIVSDEATDEAIRWLPCGKRFIIADKKKFALSILPLCFGGKGKGSFTKTKFTSFTRRLKRWNFQRVPAGKDIGAYYHEYFLKDQPELAKMVVYPLINLSTTVRGESGSPIIGKQTYTQPFPSPVFVSVLNQDTWSRTHKTFIEDSAEDMDQKISSVKFESKRFQDNLSPVVNESLAFSDPLFLHAPFLSSTIAGSSLQQEEVSTGSKVFLQMRCHSNFDHHLSMQRTKNLHDTTRSCLCPYLDPVTKCSRTPEASVSPEIESLWGMTFSRNDAMPCDLCNQYY